MSGGRWRYDIVLEAGEPQPDDVILIERVIDGTPAAKAGPACKLNDDCWAPQGPWKKLWGRDANYSCFADLPDSQRGELGDCFSVNTRTHTDLWCQLTCNAGGWWRSFKCATSQKGQRYDDGKQWISFVMDKRAVFYDSF